MLSAFNVRATPELVGTVSRIAADRSIDAATAEAYYSVEIQIGPDEIGKLDGQRLLPGMPAEAFILTGSRTAIAYVLRPITDHLMRAWRED